MTSINGKRRRIGDDVVYFFIYLCAALSVVLLAGIIIYVFVRGIGQVNWQFLTSETSGILMIRNTDIDARHH